MSDHRTREFRAQLTTAMDSIMRRTMFEVMKIFENSLSDFKLELVHKEEEITHLKVQLQKAEVGLKDVSDDKAEEKNTSEKNQSDKDPGQVPQLSEQPSIVPEFDFEVPDDWCAPLGSEMVPNKDNECPSVRLRKLYIPLWHVPAVKQEVDSHSSEILHRGKRGKKRKCGSTSKAKLHQTPGQKDLDRLVQDNSEGCADHSKSARKEQKQVENREKSTKSVYYCRICEKDFTSESGLKVHFRSHVNCKGCNKILPSKPAFSTHKITCKKYRRFMNRRGRPSKTQEKTIRPFQHKEKTTSPSQQKEKPNGPSQQVEKTIKCSLCPKTFHLKRYLKLHMTTIHIKKEKLGSTKEESSWTMPLELTDNLSL